MIGKSIFIWNTGGIFSGNVARIAQEIKNAGFDSAMLHHQNLTYWRNPARVALIDALRHVGVEPIGSAAVYAEDPVTEGEQAARICEQYGLKYFVFDAEATYDRNDPTGSKTQVMLNTFKQNTSAKIGWCWWARYKDPSSGNPWHPVAVLRAAMPLADFGVPMAYWSGDTVSSALYLARETLSQWRLVTIKPLVPAGRAYNGDGGTATKEAMDAFANFFYSHIKSGNANGITWWSMEHVLNLNMWNVLAEMPGYGDGNIDPIEEGSVSMNGISLTDESNLADARTVKNSGYEFGYVRGYKTINGSVAAGRDDQKITEHRSKFIDAGIKFGVFGDFDFRNGMDDYQQAAEIAGHWNINDDLPPAIRLWEVKDSNGKVIPPSDWYSFANKLGGVAYHIWNKTHKWPVIMANRNQISQILAQMPKLGASRDNLQNCWWGIIAAPGNAPVLPAPLTRYPFFVEFVSGGQTVSGAGNISIAHWPGDIAQLENWTENPTINNIPTWGEIVEPDPIVDPVVPPVTSGSYVLKAEFDALKIQVELLASRLTNHTHPGEKPVFE